MNQEYHCCRKLFLVSGKCLSFPTFNLLANTFTIIAEFKGGTYCSQVRVDDLKDTLTQWLKSFVLDGAEVAKLDKGSISEIEAEIADPDTTLKALQGLSNVWCTSFSITKGLFLLNIVKTQLT